MTMMTDVIAIERHRHRTSSAAAIAKADDHHRRSPGPRRRRGAGPSRDENFVQPDVRQSAATKVADARLL